MTNSYKTWPWPNAGAPSMQVPTHRRVLVVDDSAAIHEDFRKILAPDGVGALADTEAALFGMVPQATWRFELDFVFQGQSALRRVEAAVAAGRPFAVAFVDMRMPPGWDGMETVERLWQADPRLQVVICTAYSDHPWDTLLQRLDVQDRLLIVKKPFDLIEVGQLARTLSTKWLLARQVEERARAQEGSMQQLRHHNENLQAFAHAVSHDLRSPMALIGSFCALLEEELQDHPGHALRYLKRVRAHADLGQQILAGLMALAGVDGARLEPGQVDVGTLVQEWAEARRQAEPGRVARITVQPGLTAWGDPRLLRIALRNLLENAWKFSARQPETCIDVGAARSGAVEQVLFVRDQGCGFDMADAAGLFRAFERLHQQAEYPGTGLGLATVERVALRHGGRVWFHAEPGRGSSFYLALPAAPRRAPPIGEALDA